MHSNNLIQKLSPKLPALTILIILFSILYTDFNIKLYNKERRVIYHDVLEYYSYLPATFIYKDVTFKFTETNPSFFSDKFWPLRAPNGNKVSKMSMGLAFVYAPFFFAAHYLAPILGYDANGFTAPYKLALMLSSAIFLVIGLFFLWKILKNYFSPIIISLTFLGITYGTNLFYYTTLEAPLTHVYSFAFFSIFTWLSIKWHRSPKISISLLLGFTMGIITLIRPTNCVISLFFILWGIKNREDIKNRFLLFLKNYYYVLIIFACAFIVWVPQMIYWKHITGNWLYYSYGKEKFFFNDPQIINGLFSFRKGWLLYTPLMILPFFAFFSLYKNYKEWFWPVLVIILTHIYIVTSWWTWWYGGSFGQRPMIETYAILAFPLAIFLQKTLTLIKPAKFLILYLYTLLIMYSLFQSAQYYYCAIHWDSMSRKAYFDSFLKLHASPQFDSLISPPDYESAIKGNRNQ